MAALGATVTGRPARLGSARHGTPWSERDGTITNRKSGGRSRGRSSRSSRVAAASTAASATLPVGPGQAQQGGQQRRQVAGGVRGAQRAERQRPARAADDGMEHAIALGELDEDATLQAGGEVGGTQPALTAQPGAGPGPAAVAQLLLGGPESATEAHELPRPGVRLP